MLSTILSKLEKKFVGNKVRITFTERADNNCTGMCVGIERVIAHYQHRILYDEFKMKLAESHFENPELKKFAVPPYEVYFIPFKSGKHWVEGPLNGETVRIQVVS